MPAQPWGGERPGSSGLPRWHWRTEGTPPCPGLPPAPAARPAHGRRAAAQSPGVPGARRGSRCGGEAPPGQGKASEHGETCVGQVWKPAGLPPPPQPAAPTRVVTKPPEFALSFQFRALESLHVSCVYLLIPTASEKKNRLFFFLLNFWTLIEDKWQMVFIKIPLLFPPPPALGVFRQTVQTSGDAHVQKHSIFLRSVTRSYRLSRALFPGANFGDTAVPRTSPLRPVL